MKTKLIGALIASGIVLTASTAWALLSGVLVTPDVMQGLINGTGSGGCQTGGVTFEVPDPVWDNTLGDYMITSIGYDQIATACVSLGTADLVLNITDGGPSSITTATATNMQSSSGTLTLSNPISFDDATTGQYSYIVKDQ